MVNDLLKKYPLISDQVTSKELEIILKKLRDVLDQNITGDVVEMGCYVGTTSLFISRIIGLAKSNKKFHVYDSFDGLPGKSSKDNSPAGMQFKVGELKANKKQFIENYKKANLPLPLIHKVWFSELKDNDLPDNIAFAFLDGDYYESIRSCLKIVDAKLSKGSIVIVDDYQNEALPGARIAVDEWIKCNDYKLNIEQSLAIITVK